MSNLVFSIDDSDYTITRPVAYDIVKNIMDYTQISSKTKLEIIGEEGRSIQPGSAIDNFNFDHNKYAYNDKVTIEVSEAIVEDFTLATQTNRMFNMPFFKDERLAIIMRPINVITELSITFKYRAEDRNKAIKWQNAIRAKSNMGMQNLLHTVKYSYPIPYQCIGILKEIHRLRNNVAAFNDSFEEYMENNSSRKLIKVSNQSGSYQHFSIAETQNNIQGAFDFNTIPDKPEKVDDSSSYLSTFTYKVKYNKPLNVNIVYPSFIHNQVLDEKFRFDDLTSNMDYKNGDGNFFQMAEKDFYNIESISYPNDTGYVIPNFDSEFEPGFKITATGDVITAVTLLDTNNIRFLLNLKDLGDYELDPDVLEYLKYENNNITKRNNTIFNLNLYCFNELLEDSKLLVDNDLNVFSTEDLDLRKTYRVRLSLLCDLQDLTNKQRFKEYCLTHVNFRNKIGKAIYRLIRTRTVILKRPNSKYTLTLDDLILLGIINRNDLFNQDKLYLDYINDLPFYPLSEILFLTTK